MRRSHSRICETNSCLGLWKEWTLPSVFQVKMVERCRRLGTTATSSISLRLSPYQAAQGIAFEEEFIHGNWQDLNTVFQWDVVILNRPGSNTYNNQSLLWVFQKCRSSDIKIAVDVFSFVDDFCQTGNTRRKAWLVWRHVASHSNHRGVQDVPRNRCDGGMAPVAWTGSVVQTSTDGVLLLISDDKWKKTKLQLMKIPEMILKDQNSFS
eukprot:scaffold27391_cov67-Attheya_sp.AAC.7